MAKRDDDPNPLIFPQYFRASKFIAHFRCGSSSPTPSLMPLMMLNVSILIGFFLLQFVAVFASAAAADGKKAPLPKVTNVEMSTEEGFRIYQHWVDQAITSLMSAFLHSKMNNNELPMELPDQFSNCYLSSSKVPAMAKCISQLLNGKYPEVEKPQIKKGRRFEKYKKVEGKRKRDEDKWIGQFQVEKKPAVNEEMNKSQMRKITKIYRKDEDENYKVRTMKGIKKSHFAKLQRNDQQKKAHQILHQKRHEQMQQKRYKRKTTATKLMNNHNDDGLYRVENARRREYSLMESKRSHGLSPIGGLARLLMANLISKENKPEIRRWQQTVAQIKELKLQKENMVEKFTHQNSRDRDVPRKKGVRRRLDTLRKLLDTEKPFIQKPKEKPIDQQISDLVRQGINLGMKLAKQNSTQTAGMRAADEGNEDGDEVEVLSPRFLSISERDANEKSALFSPSVFSLHNKGTGIEGELSLPKLMKEGQFTGRDQQEWLDLIMEASGVNEQVDSMKNFWSTIGTNKMASSPSPSSQSNAKAEEFEARYKREFKGLYLTKENARDLLGEYEERKVDTWTELNRKFTQEQLAEMNGTGYAILTRDQLEFIYGPASPFNDTAALQRLRPILEANNNGTMNSSTINRLIEMDIHRMAQMRSFDLRQHDVVLSPAVFRPAISNSARTSQPFILSPFLFSPTITSPTIFGVAILSPRVFSPTILSPRLMTPLILSPFIFSTIILSPIVMQPFILSPGLLNSVILSPFVMNPMILSSQIMHPFILSPLVMTPGIVNPSSMTPYVLSPFVMNPQVFSPKAISGLILSPYALSPVIMSPVYAYVVILSPSVFS